jgi:hypothetical protein
LILDKASFYCDGVNPSNNTAEWDIVISKSGRFKVWITSATQDTRADSYMGSLYVAKPGEYNIQLISEKVIMEKSESKKATLYDDTKLMSVMLTPLTH